MKSLITALLIVAGATTSHAKTQVPTADAMYRFCMNENPGDYKLCHGYIRGIVEYHQFIEVAEQKWCLPDGWDTAVIVKAIIPRLEQAHRTPKWGQMAAYGFVSIAIAEAFPCDRGLSALSDEELLELLEKLRRKGERSS